MSSINFDFTILYIHIYFKIVQQLEDTKSQQEEIALELEKRKNNLEEINSKYDRVKLLLEKKEYARTRRQNNPTTYSMIQNRKYNTRFRRKEETSNMLQFIHGGEEGSLYGAWDYLASNAPTEIMDKLISGYKRGKYLQGIFGRASDLFNKSEDAIKQAVAMKYHNHLSRRKFNLVCKTQSSVFDPEKETWLPRCIKHGDIAISLPKIVTDFRVDKFVRSLDIGYVCQIPGCPGVSRTVTGLIFMILDLHLRLPHLKNKLIWFNDNPFHFIFQFSDDGAPETSELSMSIGSLTCWNFGNRVRSREYQYLLHCLSVGEKDQVMEDLWLQHSDELLLLEDNILNICSIQCTVEFQPSADQSWQSWANNELNQAATYPSPYANVHKGNMCVMGGTIGTGPSDTWIPPSKDKRKKDLDKLDNFRKSLSSSLNDKQRHTKELEFMRDNGLRQCGPSRIRDFANRQRPEPVHNEINVWQHLLNLIYKESLMRNVVDKFLEVLSAPVGKDAPIDPMVSARPKASHTPHSEGVGERVREYDLPSQKAGEFSNYISGSVKSAITQGQPCYGCGLSFIANYIQEHYENKEKRSNNLSIRLIGEQAIALARYSFRLIDILECPEESPASKIKRLALGKAAQYLRDACTLFNKVDTNIAEVSNLSDVCKMYFNILVLFFEPNINVTVWTVGYAIPYHASLLYSKYKVGYGIISLQAKESKHSGIKYDLQLTNRSRSTSELGKWWQIMRANYVRAFYLTEHQPMPSSYTSHYQSRLPPCLNKPGYCECGREQSDEGECQVCVDSLDILLSATNMKLTDDVLKVLKPNMCDICKKRFPDEFTLKSHHTFSHLENISTSPEQQAPIQVINPRDLNVKQLKEQLGLKGLNKTGNKDVLLKRLETALHKVI